MKSELSAWGAKRDIENTIKCTSLNCILAQRSSLGPSDHDDGDGGDDDEYAAASGGGLAELGLLVQLFHPPTLPIALWFKRPPLNLLWVAKYRGNPFNLFFARTIFLTIVFFSAPAQSLQNYSILSQERYQSSAKLRRLDKERGGGGPSPGPTLEAAVAYWRKQKEGESVWEWVGGTILLIASHPVRCFNGKYKYTEIQKVQNYKYEIGAPFF